MGQNAGFEEQRLQGPKRTTVDIQCFFEYLADKFAQRPLKVDILLPAVRAKAAIKWRVAIAALSVRT